MAALLNEHLCVHTHTHTHTHTHAHRGGDDSGHGMDIRVCRLASAAVNTAKAEIRHSGQQ